MDSNSYTSSKVYNVDLLIRYGISYNVFKIKDRFLPPLWRCWRSHLVDEENHKPIVEVSRVRVQFMEEFRSLIYLVNPLCKDNSNHLKKINSIIKFLDFQFPNKLDNKSYWFFLKKLLDLWADFMSLLKDLGLWDLRTNYWGDPSDAFNVKKKRDG